MTRQGQARPKRPPRIGSKSSAQPKQGAGSKPGARAKTGGGSKSGAGNSGAAAARADIEAKPERIAKVIARSGLCSRRAAEALIAEGRVRLNGKPLDTPAITVGPDDAIVVDGKPLAAREQTRLWRYHKPAGLITTTHDPQGRPTVFAALPPELPRVLAVGRLDLNTEGLLLLTNDGELARHLELPATGWLRRYRVRAHGRVDPASLAALKKGVTIEGVRYGAIEASLEREKGTNAWLRIGLREGKNREIKKVLAHLGLSVTRLIRVSYGPFTLQELERGAVSEVPRRMLRDQLPDRFRQSDAGGHKRRADRQR